jgi:hypothetical protein
MDQLYHVQNGSNVVVSKVGNSTSSRTTVMIADTRGTKQMRASTSLHNNSARLTQCPDGHTLTSEESPYPRPNTLWEECVALTSMLLCFG